MEAPNNNNNNNKYRSPKQVGAIAELGDAVFTIGEKNSLSNFENDKRKIAVYAGSNLDDSMYDLMMDDIEPTFNKPARPQPISTVKTEGDDAATTTTAATELSYDPFDLKEYDKDYNQCLEDEKEYSKFKGRCFIIIMGQCTKGLVNKIEEDKTPYLKLRKSNDVTGLLNKIKGYLASPSNKEYEIDTMVQLLLKYLQMSQNQHESYPTNQARVESMSDLSYAYVDLVPVKLPDGVTKEQFKEALKSFILLKGGLKDHYGDLKSTLRTNHLSGAASYPTTMDGMASLMVDHYKPKPKNDRDSTPRSGNGRSDSVQMHQAAPSSEQQPGENRRHSATPRRSRRSEDVPRAEGIFQL